MAPFSRAPSVQDTKERSERFFAISFRATTGNYTLDL